MLPKIFGYLLAAGTVATSVAIFIMGGRFQKVEAAAYTGERRPWWFYLASVTLVGLYLAALVDFLRAEQKRWAGWALMVLIPAGWVVKGVLVIFNPQGQQKVTAIEGDEAWRKIALARLPVAAVLAALARFA
jgi:hypothetical protein